MKPVLYQYDNFSGVNNGKTQKNKDTKEGKKVNGSRPRKVKNFLVEFNEDFSLTKYCPDINSADTQPTENTEEKIKEHTGENN